MDTTTNLASPAPRTEEAKAFPFTGQPVIVRARDAGVHFGNYNGHNGREVQLTNSRRLWRWFTVKGISLSDVATTGLDTTKSKVAAPVADIVIMDACEIIAVTDEALATILEAPIAARA